MGNTTIIFGPPGTGKTTRLLGILKHEVDSGVPLDRIAYVSFTRKAVGVVMDRLGFTVEDAPWFRTLHSTCFKVTGCNKMNVMNASRYSDFGKKAGFSLSGYVNQNQGLVLKGDDDLAMLEQLYRNNREACEKYLDTVDYKRFVAYMGMYSQYKSQLGFLDFTDMLEQSLTCEPLDIDVAIIDEAQDLTSLQWRSAFHLFSKARRMYVGGDDDQAVYEFSGADVGVLLGLKGERVILDKSYRLPDNLVMYADDLARNIEKRVDKKYRGVGERVGVLEHVNDLDEVVYGMVDTRESWFVLTRNNFMISRIVDMLEQWRVWFKVKGTPYVSQDDMSIGYNDLPLSKRMYVDCMIKKYGDDYNLWPDPLVDVSTIHGVKGDEADNVVLMTDITKGVSRTLDICPDSEHRVFYVGFTRSRNRVFVVGETSRFSYPYLSWIGRDWVRHG